MENPQTARCCGSTDCELLPDGAVKEVDGGFLIKETGEIVRYSELSRLFVSIDQHFWWCHYDVFGTTRLRARCLFIPGNT
jgi:hypothetical protein